MPKAKPKSKMTPKSPLRDIIESSGEEVFQELGHNKDPELDMLNDLPPSGPGFTSAMARHKDEMVIDELLASVPRNQGYYLKLYRVTGPNQFELKERVDAYDTWTDLEWEVTNIVRHRTQKEPRKWGSGQYRVVVWNESGMRGQKYRPIDVYVDAQEPTEVGRDINPQAIDPMEAFRTNMGMFTDMAGAFKLFAPPAQDPSLVQKQIGDAFTSGMQARVNEGSSQVQMMGMMMTSMMTMMKEIMSVATANQRPVTDVNPPKAPEEVLHRTIATLKDMGVFPEKERQKTIIEQMGELKALGFDPFKQNDPMQQIGQVKAIANLVQSFMGAGDAEKPGIADKLVDALVPAIPSILDNIRGISDNYMKTKTLESMGQGQGREQGQPLPAFAGQPSTGRQITAADISEPLGSISGGQRPTPTASTSAPSVDPQQAFIQTLQQAVAQQDREYFPTLTQVIEQVPNGPQFLSGLITGQITNDYAITVVNMLTANAFIGKERALAEYLTKYRGWLIGMVEQQHANMGAPNGAGTGAGIAMGTGVGQRPQPPVMPSKTESHLRRGVIGVCLSCGEAYDYLNEDEYTVADKVCEAELGGGQLCQGHIERLDAIKSQRAQ